MLCGALRGPENLEKGVMRVIDCKTRVLDWKKTLAVHPFLNQRRSSPLSKKGHQR